jgi:hypothetical protein
MSKKETPMTRWFWEQTGGLLIEEFQVVKSAPGISPRVLDGLIVLGEDSRISRERTFDIENKEVIAIQTKNSRLGMYLLGQCVFSRDLLRLLNPKSVRSIALCSKGDALLENLLQAYDDCEVVIYSGPPILR